MRRDTPHDPSSGHRIRIALVNDHELIVAGLHELLRPYADILDIVDLAADRHVGRPVDVALYDSYAMGVRGWSVLDQLVRDPQVGATLVYTHHVTPESEAEVRQRGVQGILDKRAGAQEIVDAVLAVTGAGAVAGAPAGPEETSESGPGQWPGQWYGLSEREAETLALICQGLSNVDVAERLAITLNTVKTYIRSSYRKIGVRTRSEAVLWGSQHGFASRDIPLPRLRDSARED